MKTEHPNLQEASHESPGPLEKLRLIREEIERQKREGIKADDDRKAAIIAEATDMAEGNAKLAERSVQYYKPNFDRPLVGAEREEAEIGERVWGPKGRYALDQEILRLNQNYEALVKEFEGAKADLEASAKGSSAEVSAAIAEAKKELEKMKITLDEKVALLNRGDEEVPEKIGAARVNWKGFDEEQKRTMENPEQFAAEQILEARKQAGETVGDISPEDLAKAVNTESRRRGQVRAETSQREEAAEIKATLTSLTEQVNNHRTLAMQHAENIRQALSAGRDVPTLPSVASLEKLSDDLFGASRKSSWFSFKKDNFSEEASKIKAQAEALREPLRGEIRNEVGLGSKLFEQAVYFDHNRILNLGSLSEEERSALNDQREALRKHVSGVNRELNEQMSQLFELIEQRFSMLFSKKL
ncbi:MAG: hypothetical protein WCT25_02550 [Candidatus Paceibacterota bacterium]